MSVASRRIGGSPAGAVAVFGVVLGFGLVDGEEQMVNPVNPVSSLALNLVLAALIPATT